ncbi:MAG: T9SS type A sorting domain-containing protein, partial [Candidatus Peribacteria bacterium]|nr:T9SS type A sorting domain-containing protein [Candidatus Peribacteria bacterium]
SLPGPYSNIGGATTVNYISWPEIWVNGVKMGNITHNGSQFSYADGITPEIFHVEQSGEYIVLKPTNSTDVVEVKHSSYFAYNGDSESPYTKLLSGVITSGPSQNVIAQLQTSYILPVSNGTYTSMTRDSYSGNSTYFSPFIVNYSSGSGINIVEKEELSIFFTSPSVLSFKSESPIQRVALYSIAGNKVVEKRGEIQELEVSYLSSGVYMVQVLLKNGRTFSQKIVK